MSVHIRRLTTSHRPVFLVNSRLGRVTAAPTESGHPFSLGYGVNLPSSLARILSSTLGFSPRLPVSVCGTVTCDSNVEVFLGSLIRISLCAKRSYSHLGVMARWIYLPSPPTCLNPDIQHRADLSLLRHPIVQTNYWWYRNI